MALLKDKAGELDLAAAARLTGLSPANIRRWQKMGVVGGGENRLDFVDLRLLRSFATMLRLGLPARRLNRVLKRLGAPEKPLTTDGRFLLYRRHQELWNVETGQGHIDFSDAGKPATLVHLANPASQKEGSPSADDWYQLALSLESSEPKSARDLYARALRTDDQHVPSRINLGRLWQLQGNLSAAVREYRAALSADPGNPEAIYNLATIFDDLEEGELAIRYYETVCDSIPDAHLHLVRLFEEQGNTMRAKWHLAVWQRGAADEVIDQHT